MSAATSIQWTQRTWNPIRGCSRVSAGCDNCYAMNMAHRFSGAGKPFAGLTTIRKGKIDWTGVARFVPEQLGAPLRWRKPQRVFVNSMSDLFHPSLSNEEIAAVFGVMAACPQHTFQVLTKQPKRAAEWFNWVSTSRVRYWHSEHGFIWDTLQNLAPSLATDAAWSRMYRAVHGDVPPSALGDAGAMFRWPLPNVWLGVSVEDQKTADDRVSLLLEIPAAIRFVSYEPALGPVDFDLGRCDTHDREFVAFDGDSERGEYCSECAADGFSGELSYGHWLDPSDEDGPLNGGINWVIVGGESGPGARSFDLRWASQVVDQCAEAGVACFVKQLGSQPVVDAAAWCAQDALGVALRAGKRARQSEALRAAGLVLMELVDRSGGDMSEWPVELRVREFPAVRS